MLGWDGQLEDDARLVTTVARTAASYGAHVRTRARVLSATGTSVQLRDELHRRRTHTVTARTVVNATGVWAGDLVDEVRLRPEPRHPPGAARGDAARACGSSVFAPIPGTFNRFVLVLPQPDGTIYVGLTDEPADGPVPDVPRADRARDRLPARRGRGGLRAAAAPHRRGRRVRRAAAAARRRAPARPPTCRAGTPR